MATTQYDPEAIKPLLKDIGQGPTRGRSLTREEARFCLDAILDGRATPAQAGAFLLLQRFKGETPDELLGFADAVRERANTTLIHPKVEGLLDVGSPYDGRLRNIVVSPAAAIVAAAAGAPSLLHGERDIPPKHGTTIGDVLDAIGVPTNLPAPAVERNIEELGIGYLRQERFAPDLTAIRWLREETALRSPLNMVEKIYDPAGAPYHIVGLTHVPYLDKLGGALVAAGFTRTAVVQGLEGNEDLPTSRAARVNEFAGDEQREYRVDASDYGMTPATKDDLAPGEGAQRGAELTLETLRGDAPDAWRDLVLYNAGFRIYLGGRAPDIAGGIERARDAVEGGEAQRLLERWREAG